MGCLFCNIVDRKIPADIVYEDDHVLAFRDIRPVAPTHVLVIPKLHLEALREAEPSHAPILGQVLVAARRVAETLALVPEGFRLVINDGAAAGQTVFHVHAHILGGRSLSWPPG